MLPANSGARFFEFLTVCCCSSKFHALLLFEALTRLLSEALTRCSCAEIAGRFSFRRGVSSRCHGPKHQRRYILHRTCSISKPNKSSQSSCVWAWRSFTTCWPVVLLPTRTWCTFASCRHVMQFGCRCYTTAHLPPSTSSCLFIFTSGCNLTTCHQLRAAARLAHCSDGNRWARVLILLDKCSRGGSKSHGRCRL